jgi:hypothetical protein
MVGKMNGLLEDVMMGKYSRPGHRTLCMVCASSDAIFVVRKFKAEVADKVVSDGDASHWQRY